MSASAQTAASGAEPHLGGTPEELLRSTLARDNELVRRGMQLAIPQTEPRRYLYDLVTNYQAHSGKGFRASLCLAACRAFGGRSEDAVDAAVAIELMHSAFLVHDDIEDGATRRRGQPALHVEHGLALALNAGDSLCALALSALARCAARQPPEVGAAMLGEIAHLFRRTVEGQAWELGWIADRRFDVDEADYLRMVLGKTCWYSTIHPLRLGALIGSRGKAKLDALVPFGCHLGVAFQVRDDMDNLTAREASYGKDFAGDIIEGKRTIPLLHLLAHSSEAERREVTRLVSGEGPESRDERVAQVLERMAATGSLEHGRDMADSFARLALQEAPGAFREARSREDVDYISALVLYLCGAVQLGSSSAPRADSQPLDR
jgi:geranylgeranyl diphosphate synthase type II